MKRKIIITSILLLVGFILYQSYVFFLAPTHNLQSFYLIPKDAIYVIETEEPIDAWDKISNSEIWKHLQKNEYFNKLTESLNKFDGIFHENKGIVDFIGNRSLLISAHMIKKKDYSLFFVVDLQNYSKLDLFKSNLSAIISDDYKLTTRNYHDEIINEIYDKTTHETLYLSFIKNQLIASYTHVLVEASIDQYQEPNIGRDLNFVEVHKKVGYDDMFRSYIQYKYLDDYLYYFSDKPNNFITAMSENLVFSAFNIDLKSDQIIYANGYTNTKENTENYIKALQKSGKGKRTIAKVAPKRTAIYMSFAFDSFTEFYNNFEEIQQENPKHYKAYQSNLDKVENLLKINVKENFMSWIGNEIALIHMQSNSKISAKNEIALVVKAKDVKAAKTNLDFIIKQVKKKTPVKFKRIDYKDYKINFLSIKGFYKVFFGDLFSTLEKPYFTIIDKYVIFSNHPSTLKHIINDYIKKETLASSDDYIDFIKNFDTKSSVFAYINTPTLYKNLQYNADKNTAKKLVKNKDYIICFPQFGFQLTPYKNLFESKLVINFQKPELVKTKDQFKEITNTNQHNEPNDAIFNIAEVYLEDLNQTTYLKKYENGNTHLKIFFKDGMKNGKYREYYPDGKLKVSGKYKNDRQINIWKAYTQEGSLILKKRF